MAGKAIWVVVADGANAAVYASQGPGEGIDEPALREFAGDDSPTRDINADRPGRTFDSSGGARHAKEPHTDAHRHAQQVLAGEVAEFLDAAAARGDYDKLVIAAPPKTLGDLRAGLTPKVQEKLVGDLDKDLMNVPVHQLAERFAEIVKL